MTTFLSSSGKSINKLAFVDCGDPKALSEYYRHPRMADGHLDSCADCRKGYQRSRPYDREYERRLERGR